MSEWGLYPWFPDDSADLIHPDDIALVRVLLPYGKVLRRVGEAHGYLQLSYGERTFRVRPTLFEPVPTVAFAIGDAVTIRAENVEGIVEEVRWHHNEATPFYHLRRLDGKRDSRRYWAADLAPAAPH